MNLYTYVVADDTGFAPHPFGDYCTLACCKPVIRRTAKPGDWIVGIGSVNNVGNDKIIYVMEVTEKITFNEYYKDNRFQNRIDNIYQKHQDEWVQKTNPYHGKDDIEHDTKTEYVLISDNYFYFGKKAVQIPEEFRNFIKGGRGHRKTYSPEFIQELIRWIKNNYSQGIHSMPSNYHDDIEEKGNCS